MHHKTVHLTAWMAACAGTWEQSYYYNKGDKLLCGKALKMYPGNYTSIQFHWQCCYNALCNDLFCRNVIEIQVLKPPSGNCSWSLHTCMCTSNKLCEQVVPRNLYRKKHCDWLCCFCGFQFLLIVARILSVLTETVLRRRSDAELLSFKSQWIYVIQFRWVLPCRTKLMKKTHWHSEKTAMCGILQHVEICLLASF